jgi:hypothetical protein
MVIVSGILAVIFCGLFFGKLIRENAEQAKRDEYIDRLYSEGWSERLNKRQGGIWQ